jgi:hypothetical protein
MNGKPGPTLRRGSGQAREGHAQAKTQYRFGRKVQDWVSAFNIDSSYLIYFLSFARYFEINAGTGRVKEIFRAAAPYRHHHPS